MGDERLIQLAVRRRYLTAEQLLEVRRRTDTGVPLLDVLRDLLAPEQYKELSESAQGPPSGWGEQLLPNLDEDPDRTPAHEPDGVGLLPRRLPSGDAPEIHGYQVLRELARGGMAVVYEARPISEPERAVALKVVLAGRSDEEATRRFQVEGAVAGRLTHPHIVGIHDVGESGEYAYIVMDLVRGESLKSHVTRLGALPAARAVELLAQLAEALVYAHGESVLHRDLKPHNVLIREHDGAALIADFGLAKLLGGQDVDLTISGQVLGTPTYMSPEQACGDRNRIGEHSDVYSLGATFYEMLTGRPPFTGDTVASQLVAIMLREPPRPTALVPGLDGDLEAICLRCLDKDPARRYQRADELLDDVRRWQKGEPVLARLGARSWRQAMLEADDEDEATALCKSAAEAGDRDAMGMLIHRLVDGIGCPADPRQALEWGRRAAAAGHAPSMTALGLLYERGLGVSQDLGQARHWYTQAIQAGETEAIERLKELRERVESGYAARRATTTQSYRSLRERTRATRTGFEETGTEAPVAPSPVGPDPHARVARAMREGTKHYLLSTALSRPFLLAPGRRNVVGRANEADLQIRSELVSREHLALDWADGALIAVDLGSTNGTFINGYLLEGACPLRSGDVLTVGQEDVLVRCVEPGEADEHHSENASTRSFRVRPGKIDPDDTQGFSRPKSG